MIGPRDLGATAFFAQFELETLQRPEPRSRRSTGGWGRSVVRGYPGAPAQHAFLWINRARPDAPVARSLGRSTPSNLVSPQAFG
jgi:hypothetical protein